MTTARQVMSIGAECADTTDTITTTARRMRDLGVDALPICGEERWLRGMITEHDIVAGCVARGLDGDIVTVGECATAAPVAVGADDSVEEALRTMAEHGVRRLPVIDGTELVGMVSQADLAAGLADDRASELVRAIAAGRAHT